MEAIPGGGLVPSWRFDGIRLMRSVQGFGLVGLVCEALFAVFTIYFTVVVVRAIFKDRKEYFKVSVGSLQ
jgi:hypothetical protein